MRETEADQQTRTETFPPQPPAEAQTHPAEAIPGEVTRRWNLWRFPPKGKQKGKGKGNGKQKGKRKGAPPGMNFKGEGKGKGKQKGKRGKQKQGA
jgi:hypothetical protein